VRKPIAFLALLLTASALGAAFLGPASSHDAPAAGGWGFEFPQAEASGAEAGCQEAPAPRVLALDVAYSGGTQCAVVALDLPGAGAGESGGSAQAAGFSNLVIPGAIDAGEPTIGVTPTGSIIFQEYQRNWKSTNGGNTWAINSVLPLQEASLDPMMWVDTITGRVFIVHLYVGCSQLWWSDADGASLSWRYNPAACGTPGNDHPKIATGPFAAPLAGGTAAYPNAVYYCYNGLVYGGCSLSPTGGATWDPATLVPCGGTLGHPHVAADGTLYVPSTNCGSNSVSMSLNNGIGWTSRTTGGAFPAGESLEPDVATTPDGTVYLAGVVNKGGGKTIPHVFTSTNKGLNWVAHDITGTTGVQSAVFPVVTTGINGRAAVAFLGTTCTGGPSVVAATCTWQLYVSFTYDAGATWETVQASPTSDPVQRGSICLNGTGCGADRNLLDFIDVTHDNAGFVLVAYADGCVSAACKAPTGTNLQSRSAQGTVAKQTSGTPLL
jgi:hypothetical protein